jgi:16S rRNA G966 N2-methylase RsmD
LRALHANLELAPAGRARLLASPADAALRQLAREPVRFDLLFADPPYDRPLEPELPGLAAAVAAPRASWAFEHRARDPEPAAGDAWLLVETRRYGDSALSLYRPA